MKLTNYNQILIFTYNLSQPNKFKYFQQLTNYNFSIKITMKL